MIQSPSDVNIAGPGSISWRVIGERRGLLAAGRTLLLQVAHPVVGAGVVDHSNFQDDPWGRLRRTIDSLLTQVYGGEDSRIEAARLISLHRSITGVDARGKPYSALDPEAYAWVHLTIFESTVHFQRHFAAPLTLDEEMQFYAEWRKLGLELGIPENHLPPTLPDFWAYFEQKVEQCLERNQAVQDLLASLSGKGTPPPYCWMPNLLWRGIAPLAGKINRVVMVGLLPPSLRCRLELSWSRGDKYKFWLLGRLVRFIFPLLPLPLRYFSFAGRAIRDSAHESD